jgi:hypothetical protein
MDAGIDASAGGTDAGLDASVDASTDAGDAEADAGDGSTDAGCPGQDASWDIDDNGVADCSENLLTNSQFTTNIASWSEEPSAEGLHVVLADAGANGVLQVTSTVMSNAPNSAGVGQCVQVDEQSQYVMGGQFFIEGGQGVGGLAAQIAIKLYEGTACDGDLVNDGGTNIGNTTDAWTTLTAFVNTTSAHSVFVSASVRKAADPIGDAAVVLFDNLLLRANQ